MGAPSAAARARPETADRRPPTLGDAPKPLHRSLSGELVAPGTNRHAGRVGGPVAAVGQGPSVTILLPLPVIQTCQVLTIAVAAPGISGVIATAEARLQGRRGPRLLQPYFDLWKSFGKEALAPEGTGPFFLLAPVVSFACFLTVPLLIPVLTSYALPLGYMGDILGGGFILALASFLVAVAAAETGGVYAQLGSSRSKTFAAITEPVVLLVVFTVALVTTTDLPYVLGATIRSGPDQIVRPAHLLASAALFMVCLLYTSPSPRDGLLSRMPSS